MVQTARQESSLTLPKWTWKLLIVALLCYCYFNAKHESYTEGYSTGFHAGAMSIIDKLVAGENISYLAPDGNEFNVQLSSEEPEYYQHEQVEACYACHKYDVRYPWKGGEQK